MKRVLTWHLFACLIGAFALGCGGIKDPPKDLKIAPAEKTQNKAAGNLDSETMKLPPMPKKF